MNNSSTTFKHQFILSPIYAKGCRLSELRNHCLNDVEGNRNEIRINPNIA
ncbi:MAG: hypothetical protein WBP33_16580 [Saprospiraceae bacterium]|nr:hypothetical protein [Candidatus Vicinibacter proximus]HRG34547.1 hypothetical protein [Saprospiraceae bacterium]